MSYPKIKGVIYDGTRTIYYRKNKIDYVFYDRFENDTTSGQYVFSTRYYSKGTMRSHVLMDEANFIHYIWKFDKAGRTRYEVKIDRQKLYLIKRKGRNARKEICRIRENGETYKIIKKDGVEIKRKSWNSKDFGIVFR